MRIETKLICLLVLFSAFSCQPKVEQVTTGEFILNDGYEIELIAQEPLLQSPVAMTEDETGRIWAVEMTGYMRDIDGNGEDIPDGKIIILEDTDGDSKMDKRTVFADGLLNPRAISLVYGGALYTNGSTLVWSEIENDKPINTLVVDSLYVVGGNIEHQPNGLYYNIDNWIYSAKSTARYQRRNGIWYKEATSFRGQWGISADHVGRLVYNHNSAPLQADRTIPNTLLNNPYQKVKENIGNYYTDDMSIQAIQATAVNRGYEDGVLDESGKIKNYTSACSPLVYYGSGLSNEDIGDGFVCAPEANLISQYKMNHVIQDATKLADNGEFLVSKDESFRPVALMNGLDGGLYVLDMRKGIIQHSAYMSSYLREKIRSRKLDEVKNKGRIYRVRNQASNLSFRAIANVKTEDLPELFFDENLTVRLRAQQLMIAREANPVETIQSLIEIVNTKNTTAATLHALWTLDGLDHLNMETLNAFDVSQLNAELAIGMLPLLKKLEPIQPAVNNAILSKIYPAMIALHNYIVDINLASSFGGTANFTKEWWQLAEKYPNDKSMIEALLSNGQDQLDALLASAKSKGGNVMLRAAIEKCIENRDNKSILSPTLATATYDDDRTNGLKVFKQYCVACHGGDGLGQKNIAPSLVESTILQGPEQKVTRIILQGYDQGDNEYQIKMPAYIDNPDISDKDISDLLSYLNSTFAKKWGGVSADEVGRIRTEIVTDEKTND